MSDSTEPEAGTYRVSTRGWNLLGVLVVLALSAALGPVSNVSSAIGQRSGQVSPPPGGTWRPLSGGPRFGAVLAGDEMIVYDGSPTGWEPG